MRQTASPPADHSNRLSTAASVSHSNEAERRSIEAWSRPSAALIHETIRAEGESELDRAATALLLSGLAAGLSMGLSLIARGLLEAKLPQAEWRPIIAAFGYAFGFLVVVLGRQQLFTENTLTPILPLLHHRASSLLLQVGRMWAIVLLANTAGTWMIAALLAYAPVVGPEVKFAIVEISRESVGSSFGATVFKGLVAGWIIALMVWLMPAAGAARPFLIILLTWLVGLGGFAHIVVGSVEAAYLVLASEAGWSDYAFRFFVPTLIGNVLGGVGMVAVLNYGQVAHDIAASD
jgi:formate/nitrite transporter FocA (FNT family)